MNMSLTELGALIAADRSPPWRRQLLESEFVHAICGVLQRTGSVPMPGDHGTRFFEARAICSTYQYSPAPAERAYVVIGLLCRDQGLDDERWNAKRWLMATAAWFERFRGVLALPLPPLASRWRCMLAALVLLALGRLGPRRVAGKEDPLWPKLLYRADEAYCRLASLPLRATPLRAPAGGAIGAPGTDAEWRLATSELRRALVDPAASFAPALYFMHVLHASLVLRQPALGRRNKSARESFYDRLLKLLQAPPGPCGLSECAGRVAAGLPGLAVFREKGSVKDVAYAAKHPGCFRAYDLGLAPDWRFIAQRVTDPAARRLMEQTHRLGEWVADIVIDPVRALPPGSLRLGFSPVSYAYLSNRDKAHSASGADTRYSRLFIQLGEGALQLQVQGLRRELGAPAGGSVACAPCAV